MVTLVPALHHGLSLGPYDILSRTGLTQVPGATAHNTVSGDQIDEMIPWSTLAWTQIHQGHLPLWNTYSGLGLPLAFNWQSAVFSLPALISYAFPLHLAYTAQIVVTLIIAGTGSYALARVLGLGVIGCATAGTVYELSGSFMGWLGWPHASVMSWAGWIFALAILILRGEHRIRNVVALALVVAFAIFAGEPEIFAILSVSVVVYVVALVLLKARTQNEQHWRPVGDLSLAAVLGAALSAPLALPGLQVLSRSTRNSGTLLASTEVGKALPPHDLVHLLVQGYNGLPLAGNQVFGDAVYTDTAAYVGLIGVALAVLGTVRAVRRPEIASFVVLNIFTLAIIYAPPVQALLIHIPLVQTIDWHRDLMVVGLCFAVLAGIGMDALVRSSSRRSIHRILGGTLAAGLAVLLVLLITANSGLSALDARLRKDSLVWPLITTSFALVVVAGLAIYTSRTRSTNVGLTNQPTAGSNVTHLPRVQALSLGRVVGLLLLLFETVFLVISGAQLWSSSAQGVKPNSSVTSLLRTVKNSTVGFGVFTCYAGPGLTSLGVLPEANILYGLHELDFYDPVLPRGYIQSWADLSTSAAGVPIYNSFCPELTTAAQARRFGVRYVLEPIHAKGPSGATFDREIGGEELYRIPDSGDATLTSIAPGGALPPNDATGTPVSVAHSSPSSLSITTDSRTSQILRVRLTDEPGWKATIDGRPLEIEPFAGVMIQARIPPGRHVIQLHYWPSLFTIGLIVAGCALLFLLLLVTVGARGYHLSVLARFGREAGRPRGVGFPRGRQ